MCIFLFSALLVAVSIPLLGRIRDFHPLATSITRCIRKMPQIPLRHSLNPYSNFIDNRLITNFCNQCTGYTNTWTSNGQSSSGYIGKGIRKGYPDASTKSYLRNKTMWIRIVAQNAVSSILVAKQKKKPGNALFTRLPRLYATIRTRQVVALA